MTTPQEAVSAWRHLHAIVLLPFMNTVLIPSVLLWIAGDAGGMRAALSDAGAVALGVIGAAAMAAGLTLVVRAIGLFIARGRGTLAPWDPTTVLIADDIYRWSRNPMKAGLFLVLIGECLLTMSVALAVWTTCFMAANVIYIRLLEERGLRQRFGPAYVAYCDQVPRWIGLPALRDKRGLSRHSAP